MLVIVAKKMIRRCPIFKMSKKMIRRFYDIIKWVLCLSYVYTPSKLSFLFWKFIVEQYFKSHGNKSNSMNPHFFIFFSMILKKWEFWKTYFFVCFGLADDQKSFNATCNNYVFFYYFEVFFLLIILQQELPPVIDHLGLESTSNKMLCSPAHVLIKS